MAASAPAPSLRPAAGFLAGLLASAGIAILAFAGERLEAVFVGRAWVEGLVLALLLGAAIRLFWSPSAQTQRGVDFSAKTLLEIAIVLLGAAFSGRALAEAGLGLMAGVVLLVILALGIGYLIGRWLGLSRRTATLIACGNAICGNSAIAAVAPVIGAKGEEVSVSIGFSAAASLFVVLLLPVLAGLLHLSDAGGGALAGLSVYAVSQVLAAAAPMGDQAVELGTLVKLVRILMLGPACIALAVIVVRARGRSEARRLPPPWKLAPWFILGFLGMAGLRSLGLIPEALLEPLDAATTALSLAAMAALGLNTDLRAVARSGPRAAAAVALSLAALIALASGLVLALGL